MGISLILRLRAWLLITNPVAAFAAGVTFDKTIAGVTPLAIIMVVILSALFGLAALLNILKDRSPPRLSVFIAAHMVTALTAGMAAFAVAEWKNIDDWLEVLAIMVASYGGVRVLDLARDILLAKIPGATTRAIATSPAPQAPTTRDGPEPY